MVGVKCELAELIRIDFCSLECSIKNIAFFIGRSRMGYVR